MKLEFDEETLKKLDEYNLFRILEKASLGNLVRGVTWMLNKSVEVWDGLTGSTEIKPKTSKRKAKSKK